MSIDQNPLIFDGHNDLALRFSEMVGEERWFRWRIFCDDSRIIGLEQTLAIWSWLLKCLRGFGDVAGLTSLNKAMVQDGYDQQTMAQLCHGNWLRVLK